jgi:hypothetical protein
MSSNDSRWLVAPRADCARIEQEEGQNDEGPHSQTCEAQPRAAGRAVRQ